MYSSSTYLTTSFIHIYSKIKIKIIKQVIYFQYLCHIYLRKCKIQILYRVCPKILSKILFYYHLKIQWKLDKSDFFLRMVKCYFFNVFRHFYFMINKWKYLMKEDNFLYIKKKWNTCQHATKIFINNKNKSFPNGMF